MVYESGGPMPSQDDKAKRLIANADDAFNNRERQNAVKPWDRIARFIIQSAQGSFNNYTEVKSKGAIDHQDCYDATAGNACRDLAAALHSTLTNPMMHWAKLRMNLEKLNESKNVISWLDESIKIFHQHLNESNFDTQVGVGYQSYTALGTKVFVAEEKFDKNNKFVGFNFKTWHIGEVAYCENEFGVVDTVYRKFTMTVKQALGKFGEDKAYADELRRLKPSEELTFYHCIYPRDPKEVKLNSVGLAAPEKRPIASEYVDCKTSKILEVGGYYEMPVFVSRIATKPGEIYGFGPGHVALPDILSLNKIRKSFLRGLGQAVNPFKMTTERNIVGGSFNEGEIVYVKDLNNIKEGGTNTNFAVAKDTIEDYRNSIQKVFYIDKLLLPPRNETGEMTAFEVDQRLQQMQQVLGPVVSRLNSEFLQPLVLRCLKVLMRNGALPPIPEELKGLGVDPDIQISFVNSLARSQQLSELRNIQSWLQEEAVKAQSLNPAGLDLIDFDEVSYYVARMRNIPESFLRPTEEVKKIREDRQKQMEMQQALTAGEQVGKIVKDTKEGSK